MQLLKKFFIFRFGKKILFNFDLNFSVFHFDHGLKSINSDWYFYGEILKFKWRAGTLIRVICWYNGVWVDVVDVFVCVFLCACV